jgi:hypothetical protein
MKKLIITLLALLLISSNAFAEADTLYNKRGQGVQVFAPNNFQTLTAAQTSIDLTNTLAFEADTKSDCKVYIAPTNSKTSRVAMRLQADTPRIIGKGYTMGYAIYSGCTGTYSSMKGDYSGQ